MRGKDWLGWINGSIAATTIAAVALVVVPSVTAAENQAAQWRKGLLRWGEEWLTPEDVAQQPDTRDTLTKYAAKRDEAANTVAGQLNLANWCLKQKLPEQERAHLTRVVQLEPAHAEARRRLGFVLVDNQWMSREEVARAQARTKEALVSVDRWSRQLKSIATGLSAENEKKQAVSKARLLEIKDASVIPAMELALNGKSEPATLALVEALAAMPAAEASVALTRLAVYSPSALVRKSAIGSLKDRPQEHFIPLLLAELSTPLQSKVEMLATPDGRLTYRHWFFAEQEEIKKLTTVDQTFRSKGGGPLVNAPELALREAMLAIAATQQSLSIDEHNARLFKVLSKVTNLALPDEAEVWWSWWNDKTETYLAEEKPVYRQYVKREYDVQDEPGYYGGTETPLTRPRCECLLAGTPVWTIIGYVPIEKIKTGDLVLSQNVETGELAYKPVLQPTKRPAVPLVKFSLTDESITCSGGHLFWSEGKGWLRARQIEAGTSLRQFASDGDVQAATIAEAAPTYNLIVADFHTYFVGNSKLLSHDNSPRKPLGFTTLGGPKVESVATAQAD